MDTGQCIQRLKTIFDSYSPDLTEDIFREVNLSVQRTEPPYHWDTVVTQINSRLNSWLLHQVWRKRWTGDITRARLVLECVDHAEYLRYWLADIEREYAPVAWALYRS